MSRSRWIALIIRAAADRHVEEVVLAAAVAVAVTAVLQ